MISHKNIESSSKNILKVFGLRVKFRKVLFFKILKVNLNYFFVLIIMGTLVRFITDGMLGKLSRWLRLLGHDVLYYKSATDENLIDYAEKNDRILLTKDRKLVQQATKNGIKVFFVEGTEIVTMVGNLILNLNLNAEIDPNSSRCPKCNGSLLFMSKDSILEEIPKLTSVHYNEFWKCNGCGHVYWLGSHWKKITKTMEAVKNFIADQ